MGFTDVLKKSFPFISAAASLGGPLGTMAAAVVGKAIGADKAPAGTADGISNAIATALADPAQRAALIEAERNFQLQMAELGYKDAEELAATAAADRASAREREKAVKDRMPAVLACLAVLELSFCICLMAFVKLPDGAKEALLLLMGFVGASYKDVYAYFFGSSSGSDRKTELLAQSPAIK